jgi:phosphatidate phosphatase APP1
MARPHAAALIEDAWHRQLTGFLSGRGWIPRAIGYTGYGSPDVVRVLGRIVLSRHALDRDEARPDASTPAGPHSEPVVRGYRAFVTAQAMYVPVVVTVGDQEIDTVTDRSGYVDTQVTGHGLTPGWHEVTITPRGGKGVQASVLIVAPDVTFGLVSDIDDTVITTYLPRPLIAAWNTFVRHEEARSIVPGMAPMYRALLSEHPNAPIFYLSTGAWNTAPTLTRFLKRHAYPIGPLLLTDWGPTNTGWFRSGQDHKRAGLHRLAREFPNIRWVLVGDDGQHDPMLYGDFARDRPDVVRAIGIRELTPAEQVLSHGIPVSIEEFAPTVVREVPVVRAFDGYRLLKKLRQVLQAA